MIHAIFYTIIIFNLIFYNLHHEFSIIIHMYIVYIISGSL